MYANGLCTHISKGQAHTTAKKRTNESKRVTINRCNTPNFTSKKQALTGVTKSTKK